MLTDELDRESLALGTNPRFLAIVEEARAQCRRGLGLSTEDVRRELNLPPTAEKVEES